MASFTEKYDEMMKYSGKNIQIKIAKRAIVLACIAYINSGSTLLIVVVVVAAAAVAAAVAEHGW